MNVLYVCADRGIPLLGNKGASVHLRSVTTAMAQLGHRVTVVARAWGDGNEPPPVARLERMPERAGQATAQLERLIAEERPDVVIERYSLESRAALAACRLRGQPLTLEVNAPLADEARRFRGLEDPGACEQEQRTLRDAQRIHVVSPALLRHVRRIAPNVPAAYVPNGADVPRFRAAQPVEVPGADARTVVGFVGSMKPWHGLEPLLEAFARVRARHPRAALALVGSGPLQERLVERAGQLGLRESVIFTGAVPHVRIPSLIAGFDVGVAPYAPLADFYFQPLKIVEYMAAGKPVVYPEQGDLGPLVGDAGLPYRPGDCADLARRLEQVLADGALRAELAARAAARGAELDWPVIAARVLRFAAGTRQGEPAGAPRAAATVAP